MRRRVGNVVELRLAIGRRVFLGGDRPAFAFNSLSSPLERGGRIGMHGHGRVAQHRLGPRGGDRDVRRFARLGIDDRIAEMPEVARHGFVKHFVVADGRLQKRVPIHQPLAAIDQPVAETCGKTSRARPGADRRRA